MRISTINPSTTIEYYLPAKCDVVLWIYDVSEKHIVTLADESRDKRRYASEWDGRDNNGVPVSSGTYFYRLKAGKDTDSRKMILLNCFLLIARQILLYLSHPEPRVSRRGRSVPMAPAGDTGQRHN